MLGKQSGRESQLHQGVHMALAEADRKDGLIMFLVFDFLPWLSSNCYGCTLLSRASGNVGAMAGLRRNDDRCHRYIPDCVNF